MGRVGKSDGVVPSKERTMVGEKRDMWIVSGLLLIGGALTIMAFIISAGNH